MGACMSSAEAQELQRIAREKIANERVEVVRVARNQAGQLVANHPAFTGALNPVPGAPRWLTDERHILALENQLSAAQGQTMAGHTALRVDAMRSSSRSMRRIVTDGLNLVFVVSRDVTSDVGVARKATQSGITVMSEGMHRPYGDLDAAPTPGHYMQIMRGVHALMCQQARTAAASDEDAVVENPDATRAILVCSGAEEPGEHFVADVTLPPLRGRRDAAGEGGAAAGFEALEDAYQQMLRDHAPGDGTFEFHESVRKATRLARETGRFTLLVVLSEAPIRVGSFEHHQRAFLDARDAPFLATCVSVSGASVGRQLQDTLHRVAAEEVRNAYLHVRYGSGLSIPRILRDKNALDWVAMKMRQPEARSAIMDRNVFSTVDGQHLIEYVVRMQTCSRFRTGDANPVHDNNLCRVFGTEVALHAMQYVARRVELLRRVHGVSVRVGVRPSAEHVQRIFQGLEEEEDKEAEEDNGEGVAEALDKAPAQAEEDDGEGVAEALDEAPAQAEEDDGEGVAEALDEAPAAASSEAASSEAASSEAVSEAAGAETHA